MASRAALITGLTGQDGDFPAELLPAWWADAVVSKRPTSMTGNCCTIAKEQRLPLTKFATIAIQQIDGG